ncbi:hypothetical protein KAR91_57425 [Candidatus Pacearchaeota archaeon]|nr:hypothetical protein [Candidatus Pacearchaeota archaeon]
MKTELFEMICPNRRIPDGAKAVVRGNHIFFVHPFKRFDPVSLAIAGTGLALSYKQTLEEGKEADRLAEEQQRQINRQAESVQDVGEDVSREKRKEAKRFQASQIAQMAANGGAITGSNLGLLASTSREFEADALVISRNFGVRAMELRNKGALVRHQGRLARRSARIRGAANLGIGIGTLALLGGLGKPGGSPGGSPFGGSAVTSGSASGVGSTGGRFGQSLLQP